MCIVSELVVPFLYCTWLAELESRMSVVDQSHSAVSASAAGLFCVCLSALCVLLGAALLCVFVSLFSSDCLLCVVWTADNRSHKIAS
jgi:hypothetical protein